MIFGIGQWGWFGSLRYRALANAALGGVSQVAVKTESWVAAVQCRMGWSSTPPPMSPEALEILVSRPDAYRVSADARFSPERNKAIFSALDVIPVSVVDGVAEEG